MPAENACIQLRGPYGLECYPHINAELEIIHVTGGVIDVCVGGATIAAKAGSAVLILPYCPHSFHPRQNATGRVYMFCFRIAADFYNSQCAAEKRPFAFPISLGLEAYLKEAVGRAEQQTDEITAGSLYYPLLAEYLKYAEKAGTHSSHGQLVRQIMDYILNHLQDKITLKSLSAHFGINPASLSKLIKEYTYESFTDFINNIRVEKAITLFYEQDASVTEAASQAGFGSVRNFNRVFRATLGITPSEYRKNKR